MALLELAKANKTIDDIICFIEKEINRKIAEGNPPFLKINRILNAYKKAFPGNDIHVNHVCIAFAILHKRGKIRRLEGFKRVWVWTDGDDRNGQGN